MRKNFVFYNLIVILCAININYGQDSLYLVMTLEGQNEEPIYSVNGIGDINADGYDDFILSTLKSDVCKVFYGNNIKNFHPDLFIKASKNPLEVSNFRTFPKLGDINNDGFADFAINGIWTKFPKGLVYIYFGGGEVDSVEDFVYYSNYLSDWFGLDCTSGDLNYDGKNDLIISNGYNWYDGIGQVNLYFGKDSLTNKADVILIDTLSEHIDRIFGSHVKTLNLNGDKFDDILVTIAPIMDNDSSILYVYYGREKFQATPDYAALNPDYAIIPDYSITFGLNHISLAVLDFNNDGYDDFYVGPTKRLYFGGPEFNENSFVTFESSSYGASFGWNAEGIGDINNDGFDDLIIGEKDYLNNEGIMVGGSYIFLGNSSLDTQPDFFLEGSVKWGNFGTKFGNLGDFNNDGFNEFFIFEENYKDHENPVGKIYIYSMKKFVVDVEEKKANIPSNFVLYQNYPNPFNPSTTIKFALPYKSDVQLKIFDILGNEVRTFEYSENPAGYLEIFWDGKNSSGQMVSSGVYIYNVKAVSKDDVQKEFIGSSKLLLLK